MPTSYLVQLALVGESSGRLAVLVDATVVLGRDVRDALGSVFVGHHQGLEVAPLSELEPEERLIQTRDRRADAKEGLNAVVKDRLSAREERLVTNS